MLRIASARSTLVRQKRSIVSSLLRSRSWQTESVADLRQEARKRGLAVKGSKATLITRIQQHDQRGVTPGIPPAAQAEKVLPPGFTSVYLPDISQPDPEPQAPIPFLPDFWESHSHAATQPSKLEEPTLPKLLVVAGSSTHLDDGPSHNMHDSDKDVVSHVPLETSSLSTSTSRGAVGFWGDVADDIGIPVNFNTRAVQKALLDAVPTEDGPSQKIYSRPLNADESNGIWVLLGLLAGTWVVGGFFTRRPAPEEVTNTDP